MASNQQDAQEIDQMRIEEEYQGFGTFKFKLAESLTRGVVIQLATVFEYPNATIDKLNNTKENIGYELIIIMEEKGQLSEDDISGLVAGLEKTRNIGLAEKVRRLHGQCVEIVPTRQGSLSVSDVRSMSNEEIGKEYPYFEINEYKYLQNDSVHGDHQKAEHRFRQRMKNYNLQCNHDIASTDSSTTINDIKIAVVGQTGDGKSSTCNTIMGKYFFDVDQSGLSVTATSNVASFKLGNKKVTVVDTPGLFGSYDRLTMAKQLARVLYLLHEVNVFVFVVNASSPRFTQRDEATWAQLEETYRNFNKYCLLVYTKAETEMEDGNLDEFLKKQKESDAFDMLTGDIGWRVTSINNKARIPAEKQYHRSVLLSMADKMIQENVQQGLPASYTNEVLQTVSEMAERIRTTAEEHDCAPSVVDAAISVYVNEPWHSEDVVPFLERVVEVLKTDERFDSTVDYEKQIGFMHRTLVQRFCEFGDNVLTCFLGVTVGTLVRDVLRMMEVPAPLTNLLTILFVHVMPWRYNSSSE